MKVMLDFGDGEDNNIIEIEESSVKNNLVRWHQKNNAIQLGRKD